MATLTDVLAVLEEHFPSEPVAQKGNAEGIELAVLGHQVKLARKAVKAADVDEVRTMVEGQIL